MSAPAADSALLLIDFQRDFLEPAGRLPVRMAQVDPVLAAARMAIERYRQAGRPVIAIGNEFRPGDRLMNLLRRHASIAGSDGAQWDPRLPLAKDAPYFAKWATGAFVNPALEPWLRDQGIGTLALAGLKAGACISATARQAMARGFRVELLGDAIACDSDGSRRRALARLERRGAVLQAVC